MAASQPVLPRPPLPPGRWPLPQANGFIELIGILLPLAIAALGVWLLVSHRRAWQLACTPAAEPKELNFQRRRYRRRMQTSGILALLGIAMLGGQAIAAQNHPSLFVYFWCGVALLAVWMLGLALGDVMATRSHLQGQLRQQIVERAKLRAELERIEKDRGRGSQTPDER